MMNHNEFSDFEPASSLPEEVLSGIKEHTESFVLICFDKNGLPLTTINAPTPKDFLALERLVMDLGTGGLPLPEGMRDDEDDDDEDDDGGETWKK